jgi:dTDP-4-amino-4,6-dideoxygalactose transaminase
VLEGGQYILGEQVTHFEAEFARYLRADDSIGVASGTDAIELALRACGIGHGSQVATVSHTAVATVAAIERAGAEPLLIDIDGSTLTMSPEKLRQTLARATPRRIRAVIPVHLYGRPAPMAEILAIARHYGARVIEDAAQAHGAAIAAQKVGTFGDLAAFSFYPTKNLGAIGDGGAIVTSNPQLAQHVRELREYGWRERYVSECAGVNSRLDELQAAILRVKLRHLDADNELRAKWAQRYDAALEDLPLRLPARHLDVQDAHHLYVVRTTQRDALAAHLRSIGIPAQIHYPQAIHQQPGYAGRVAVGAGGLSESEMVCRQVLTLPLHPHLTERHVDHVAEAIRQWHTARKA